MKKIFFSLMLVCMLCAVSSADVVYTAATSAGAGIGIVKITNSKDIALNAIAYNQLGEGSIVSPYWENNTSNGNGNSKIITVTPIESTDTTVSGDQAYIFSAGNLTKPNNDAPIILRGTYGKPLIAGTDPGAYLYLASNSALREYATANFTMRNSYTLTSSDTLPSPEIKGLLVDGKIHILIQRETASGDAIINFEGQLKASESSTWNTKTGSRAMCFVKNGFAVAHNAGVQIISNGTSSDVVTTTTPVIAVCRDTGSGFYYVESGDTNFSLKHYKDKDNTTTIFNDVAVDSNNVQLMQTDYNLLVVVIGGGIRFYNMADSDALEQNFTSKDIGGNAVSIAAATTSGSNGSSGGSGCNLAGSALILLALCSIMLKKAKRA